MRPFLGAQGCEYLDLGRLWQILLIVGLVLSCAIVYRASGPTARRALRQSPLLSFYSALSIPLFLRVGSSCSRAPDLAIADLWRFWGCVPPSGSEDFLELFTTIIVALLVLLLESSR